MPRKSAAAIATLEPRGRRLEPPPGLSAAERAAFVATVRSVRPGHFADEDTPLLVVTRPTLPRNWMQWSAQERPGSSTTRPRRRRPRIASGPPTGALRAS